MFVNGMISPMRSVSILKLKVFACMRPKAIIQNHAGEKSVFKYYVSVLAG